MNPVFNVTCFQSVTNIQMNSPMKDLLVELLDEFEDLEPELVALRIALKHQGSRNTRKPTADAAL